VAQRFVTTMRIIMWTGRDYHVILNEQVL